jgi:hypothetical protein
VAGRGVASALRGAGVPPERADALQSAVEAGAILAGGVHTVQSRVEAIRSVLRARARRTWKSPTDRVAPF